MYTERAQGALPSRNFGGCPGSHLRRLSGLQGHLALQLQSGRLVEVALPVVVTGEPRLVRGGRRLGVDPAPRLLDLGHPLVSLSRIRLSFRPEVVAAVAVVVLQCSARGQRRSLSERGLPSAVLQFGL